MRRSGVVSEAVTAAWRGLERASFRSSWGRLVLVEDPSRRTKASLWTLAPRVSVPSLVVWGAEDRVVSVRKAPRIAELLPRGRLLVLPRTGHCAQMERPVSVAKAVLGMWEAVAAGLW